MGEKVRDLREIESLREREREMNKIHHLLSEFQSGKIDDDDDECNDRAHITENLLITTAEEEYDALEDNENFAVLIEDSTSLSNTAIPTFVVTSKYLAEWL